MEKKRSSLEGSFFPCIRNLEGSKLKLISPSKQSERRFSGSTAVRESPTHEKKARGFQKLPQNMERQVLRRSREKSIYFLDALIFPELEEPSCITGEV